MTTLSFRRVSERCLWAALIFSTVSQSYRYPLKINFSGTSPTYSDTPPALQIPKFVIIFILCLISLVYVRGKEFPLRKWALASAITFMSGYSLFKAAVVETGVRTDYIDAAFWPLTILIIVIGTDQVSISGLDRFFRFALIYALVSNAIEIFLFITVGRLPALAYSGSFSVRFGGFLDDPNAFSVLLYMLLGWAHYRYTGFMRFCVHVALILCIMLTQSLTAIAFLGVLTVLFSSYYLIRRPKPFHVLGIAALVGLLLLLAWAPLTDVVSGVLETKSSSVDTHLAQVSGPQSSAGLALLFGGASYEVYESWWVGSLINFGIPWCVLSWGVIGALTLSVIRAFARTHEKKHKAVMAGALLLCCYFVFGDFNLPFFKIYPANCFFFFFSYLVFFDKIKAESSFAHHAADKPGSDGMTSPRERFQQLALE